MMKKEITNLNLTKELKTRAKYALITNYFTGSLSSLVEYALTEWLNKNGVPQTIETKPAKPTEETPLDRY
ncbi:MAG: hypothetical protein LBH79_02540 [Nitrososphaerota archaeon]|jgi:hypothetical protein|nr:hypothetical protein [Nitrososphaerota archaeon]